MRHLRLWKPEGRPMGLTWVRLTVCICIAMTGLRLFADPLHIAPPKWPPGEWVSEWYGPGYFGVERARIAAQLEGLPGKQLVIVRYRSEEHTSELQSLRHLVCRLL